MAFCQHLLLLASCKLTTDENPNGLGKELLFKNDVEPETRNKRSPNPHVTDQPNGEGNISPACFVVSVYYGNSWFHG